MHCKELKEIKKNIHQLKKNIFKKIFCKICIILIKIYIFATKSNIQVYKP